MNRLLSVVVMAVALSAGIVACLPAAEHLEADTMMVALHTAPPEEDGFIDYVLYLVDADALPLDMVNSTFIWARKKTKNQYQYFKRGLTYRAAQEGIDLTDYPSTSEWPKYVPNVSQ